MSHGWMLRALACMMALGCTAVGSKLVRTPFGPRPAACVLEAPEGAVVREVEGVLLLDDEVVHVPQECHEFAARTRTHDNPPSAPMRTHESNTAEKIADGWLDNAGVYYMPQQPSTTLHKFTGQWNVPQTPEAPHTPETLYWFIGLEDRTMGSLTSIHQPVLTWGDETEGGLGGWHLWSWTCCPRNITWHSTDIKGFGPGDTIYGAIEKIDEDTWTVMGGFQDTTGSWHNTTLTSQVGGYTYNYADVTLEVYNVTSCDQMAMGDVTFTNLSLATSDGARWSPPQWYFDPAGNDCNGKIKALDASTISISHTD